MEYKFYLVSTDKFGVPLNNAEEYSIEDHFDGLKYCKMDGIESMGAAKNIYSESYSDSDRLRVYVPKEIKRKETEITFTVYFIGENRHKVYEEFNSYITEGFHRYRDTARNKWFVFYVKNELKPSEQEWKGGTPFIKMEYKLSNIFGQTFDYTE